MAYLRNKSVEFLKRFEMPAKNPSEDAQRRWREAVGTLVKNRRRRFRMVPDLDKRSQVETQRRKIQVRRRRHQSHLILSVLLAYDFSTGRLR
jgi:Ca2+-transporting ATPase